MSLLLPLRAPRTPRPLPAGAAALPGLGLLDHAVLARAVADVLGPDHTVGTARVTYLDHVPGSALVLALVVEVDGRRREAVVRCGEAVSAAARASGTPVPGRDAVLHWAPADPDLPLLAASTASLRATVGAVAGARLDDAEVARLSHVPGRRAAVVVGPFVVKGYAASADHRAADTALRLLGDGRVLPTPRRVGSVPHLRATVQTREAGRPAEPGEAVALAATAGALLHDLRTSGLVLPARRDVADQVRAARRAVAVLAAARPDEADRAHDLLARLERSAPTGLPLVASHGDFTLDQLLVGPSGVVVTDVDTACLAPAALDPACFAANLVSGRPGDAERAEAALAALVETHGPPPALRWHLAAALLRRCDRPLRRMKSRWPEKCAAVLTMTEQSMEKVSTSCA